MNKLVSALLAFATAIILLTMSGTAGAALDYCWKDSKGRGVGIIPDKCRANQERNGLLCYDKCKAGYTSNRIAGCIQNCPDGAQDDGLFCGWPSYKADEYPIWNESKCKNKHKTGCWLTVPVIGVWVERCKSGYKHVLGFCEKKEINCSALGLKGDRIANSCAKKTYGRAAQTAGCRRGQEFDAGLCYKKCDTGADGVGPVCWVGCPKGWVDCGAGCAKDAGSCASNTTDMVVSVLDSAISIATLGSASPVKALKAAKNSAGGIRKAAQQAGKAFAKEFKGSYTDLAEKGMKRVMAASGLAQDANSIQGTTRSVVEFAEAVQDIVGKNISQEEMDFQIAQQILNYTSLLDPSGVLGVVASYTKPLCNVVASGSVALAEKSSQPVGPAETIAANPQIGVKALEAQIAELQQENQAAVARREYSESALILGKKIPERIAMIAKLQSTKPVAFTASAQGEVASATTLSSGSTYLFYKNGTYARTSKGLPKGIDDGYPAKMPGGWKGIPSAWNSGLEAVLTYEGTERVYMFEAGSYARLQGVTVDNEYPKKMPGGWQGLPASWNGVIDAALYFPPYKKHYFFKGNEYVRLSGVQVDAGYPAKLPGGWAGMPADFAQGVDAATFREGHAYFIKGDRYIRFTGMKMDAGYPKSMSGNWPE